jgi:predicted SAM-dependent methyltransferase
MKLNLGCGAQVADGWVNVDYALGARLLKIPSFQAINKRIRLFNLDWDNRIVLHNLMTDFPWPDSSVDVVYSSHTLEHFSRDSGRKFLAQCHRVLRKNGIIRILVPDLQYNITEYLEGRVPADNFIENLGVLYEEGNGTLKKRLAPLFQFPHKCMYDHPRLVEICDQLGFDASARSPFDSDIAEIESIELDGRTKNSVIVEGRKR